MLVAALTAGCASTPPGAASTTPTPAPSSPPTAINASAPPVSQPVSVAATTTTTTTAVTATSGADAKQKDLDKNARTMGYKPRKEKDGTTRWCKTEATIGTRFQTTNCVSEETMAMQVQEMLQTQDYMRGLQGCNGAGCSTH
jgi:hypothetical protein